MDKIEASGRTLEEALQLAAQQLGVTTDAIDYEIVEEGTKGFLGLGQTPTVVKAWRRETDQPPAAGVQTAAEPAQGQGAPEIEEAPEAVEQAAAEPAPTKVQSENAADTILRTASEILKPMDLKVRPVLKSDTPEEIVIDLVGPDVAILIGRRGQTLDALQYLVGIIASRRVSGKRRIVLDAEGYRDRHRQLLERKAREYAAAVKAEGKEAVLEPQPARDRRIIHLALANDPDVYTYSEGEGDDRHVVISPKK
ncbi:MAG: RNA-binding cell elongation regulator Jag/EloR [Armatimonadota bacterium]